MPRVWHLLQPPPLVLSSIPAPVHLQASCSLPLQATIGPPMAALTSLVALASGDSDSGAKREVGCGREQPSWLPGRPMPGLFHHPNSTPENPALSSCGWYCPGPCRKGKNEQAGRALLATPAAGPSGELHTWMPARQPPLPLLPTAPAHGAARPAAARQGMWRRCCTCWHSFKRVSGSRWCRSPQPLPPPATRSLAGSVHAGLRRVARWRCCKQSIIRHRRGARHPSQS